MKISSQLKGGIYEVSFGYHSKLEGYATLMSDILTLYDILLGDFALRKLFKERGELSLL